MANIAALEEAVAAKKIEIEALSAELSSLKRQLDQARVDAAAAVEHPWLGKKVKRAVKRLRGYTTQSGTLQVYDPSKKRSYRSLYGRKAGDLIVVTASGMAAHRFHNRYDNESEWELA